MTRDEAVEELLKPSEWCGDNGVLNWTGVIQVHGTNFKALRNACTEAMRQIEKAQSVHDLRYINLGYSGGYDYSLSGTFHCPDEARIQELRKEADELEARVNAGKT